MKRFFIVTVISFMGSFAVAQAANTMIEGQVLLVQSNQGSHSEGVFSILRTTEGDVRLRSPGGNSFVVAPEFVALKGQWVQCVGIAFVQGQKTTLLADAVCHSAN